MSQAQCSKCKRWFNYPTGDPPESHAPCNCFPSPEQVREYYEQHPEEMGPPLTVREEYQRYGGINS